MKKVLITGITGQDGSYLAELLLNKKYKVYGLVRRNSNNNLSRINHILSDLNIIYGDLTDTCKINNIISSVRPDEIYNLGSVSHVSYSYENSYSCHDVTGLGLLRILNSVIDNKLLNCKIYQASTSELFGNSDDEFQNENTKFNPLSPYSTSKLFAYHTGKNYRDSYNLFVSNGILFNHESPRRGHDFVTRKITLGISSILRGEIDHIKIGNLNASRDWGHAEEYVNSMWSMLQQDSPEDFVIGTGETNTVRTFIEKCFEYIKTEIVWSGENENEIGVDSKTNKILVKVNKSFYRPQDVRKLRADYTKAKEKFGWAPEKKLDDIIKEMMENDIKIR